MRLFAITVALVLAASVMAGCRSATGNAPVWAPGVLNPAGGE